MPIVGFLSPTSLDTTVDTLRAFHQGLKDTGYVEGDSVVILYRWAENQVDRLPALAAELVRRRVAVIVVPEGGVAALAAKAATATIPIVFSAAGDPVKAGLVASLARPGGNLTGINFLTVELSAKRLELLRELVPAATRVAALVNPANATITESTLKDLEAAAPALGFRVEAFKASTAEEIDAAFAAFVRERPDALFVSPDFLFLSRRVQLVNLASRHAIPAAYVRRDYVAAGGLMSYGASFADGQREVGVYTGRILKGAKPADLPVAQSTKFELVINAQAARTIGLAISPAFLSRADEVVE